MIIIIVIIIIIINEEEEEVPKSRKEDALTIINSIVAQVIVMEIKEVIYFSRNNCTFILA